ncbi:MAG: OsmC family protein [Rhodocyclaceae bacterium]|nr:OsmC family protein [Rhodocyclaceae bacterium]
MDCLVKWIDGMGFLAETGSGHTLTMDGAPENGGRNLAPRPMEMMLVGAGGCTAYDVVLILQRGRHAVEDCQVRVTATRAETDPKVFTQLHYHYVVKGAGLKAAAVERAIKLSSEKYCSASIMLGHTAAVSHSCEIVDTAAQETL